MKCEPDVVLLDGWDRTYEINLIHPVDPVSAPHAAGKLRGYPALNLAQWNRRAATTTSQRVPLPWSGSQLVIANSRGSKPCRYTVNTRVVRGNERVELLSRTYERDCG